MLLHAMLRMQSHTHHASTRPLKPYGGRVDVRRLRARTAIGRGLGVRVWVWAHVVSTMCTCACGGGQLAAGKKREPRWRCRVPHYRRAGESSACGAGARAVSHRWPWRSTEQQ